MIYDTIYDYIYEIVRNYPWEWEGVGKAEQCFDTTGSMGAMSDSMTFTGRSDNIRRSSPDAIINISITGTTVSTTIEVREFMGKPGYSRPYTYKTTTFIIDVAQPDSIEQLEKTITRALNKAWQNQHQ